MGKARIYLDLAFGSEKSKEKLLAHISETKQILPQDKSIECRELIADELVSMTLDLSDSNNFKADLLGWMQAFGPDVLLAHNPHRRGIKSFATVQGDEVSESQALDKLSEVSQRVRNGLACSDLYGSELVTYLKENEVQPLEIFQGEHHFDRLFELDQRSALKYFRAKKLVDPNHRVYDSPRCSDHSTHLLFCYKDGSTSTIKELVELGADINTLNSAGQSLLHFCSLETAVYLLEQGVDPNLRDQFGDEALACNLVRNCRAKLSSRNQKFLLKIVEFMAQKGLDSDSIGKKARDLVEVSALSPLAQSWLSNNQLPYERIEVKDETLEAALRAFTKRHDLIIKEENWEYLTEGFRYEVEESLYSVFEGHGVQEMMETGTGPEDYLPSLILTVLELIECGDWSIRDLSSDDEWETALVSLSHPEKEDYDFRILEVNNSDWVSFDVFAKLNQFAEQHAQLSVVTMCSDDPYRIIPLTHAQVDELEAILEHFAEAL